LNFNPKPYHLAGHKGAENAKKDDVVLERADEKETNKDSLSPPTPSPLQARLTPILKKKKGRRDTQHDECPICLHPTPNEELLRPHDNCTPGCIQCWRTHIVNDFRTNAYRIRCLENCSNPLPEGFLKQVLTPEQLAQYDEALLKAYLLRKTSDIRQCPGANCPNALWVDPSNLECQRLECPECGTVWCRDCRGTYDTAEGEPPHQCPEDPNVDFKTSIVDRKGKPIRIQPCPACRAPVSKNGGCPTMLCVACNSSFCWHCGQTLATRGAGYLVNPTATL
jgi:hypothetical protein